MYLNKVKVKNYRSLKNVELVLDKENGTPNLSLIIGKNNSGKTSLLKIMKKMIVDDRKLSWNDFNIQYRKEIHKILVSKEEVSKGDFEGIILDLCMEYDDNDDLNNILPLMLDLNMENNIVVLEFKCQPIIHKIEELQNLVNDTELKEYRKFSDFMQENLNKYFETNIYARGYDYRSCELTDAIEKLDSSIVKKIINITGISAKRDTSNNEKDHTLSQIAAKYYENFSDEEDKIRSLREEVSKTDGILNEEYNKLFKDVIDDFKKFGNFLNGEEKVNIHSKMDVSKLLKGNTVFSYQYNEEDLPENYNGLGYMNLLGIIFEVKACFQKFRQDSNRSKINILYIEEPEAHTHPQLQYIFIKNIGKLIENEKENLNVQTIITTHSSHIVSQCKFEDTNFFIKENDNAQIKSYADLENLYKNEREVFEFVKKYITLSRAEIFFADKLILIEGDTERILLPTMMEMLDNKNDEKDVPPLLSQNISVLVIGNHAHVLSKLISFLNLKTLVITDIDARGVRGGKVKNPADAKKTTNGSLKKFFKGKSFEGLMNLEKDEKILSIEVKTEDRGKDDVEYKEDPNGNLRIAYQIKEKNSKGKSYQATSFEDSFIHLNLEFVQKLAGEHGRNAGLKVIKNLYETKYTPTELASRCIDSKTNFAIGVLMYGNNGWKIPKYIEEGLEWIRK
ncbi:MAG TPA: ATP-dependent endonuclease [Ligilactobacillus salivarius]|uniref:ATP-dependent endonuclease n=1 Tax=Ligilactobacillus salivarius TaxID=1624 RepID=A0A921IB10_9LACO|nr:ATP-dependent endonuclease [Ligilactobacillus salivarius]